MSSILNERLPTIELSYGKKLHKKVHADVYQIMPQGKLCLVWYTYWNEHNVCYLLHIDNHGQHVEKVEKTIATFSNELCYGKGTILGGILFYMKGVRTFAVADVLYHKGRDMQSINYNFKLEVLTQILSLDIKQDIHIRSQLLVASAVITKTYTDALLYCNTMPYQVHSIQLIRYHLNKSIGYYTKPSTTEAIFKITSLVTCDMYELWLLSSQSVYGIACIPDYKTSVMMNALFRDIKENSNLDLLEESDEEIDFENIDPEKYVNLDTFKIMRCVYLPRFKKWKPVCVCPPDTTLSSKEEILQIEKKYSDMVYGKSSNFLQSKEHSRNFYRKPSRT